ncbi:MAG: DUF364 domain-containing protein [Bacteroidales bacterium]
MIIEKTYNFLKQAYPKLVEDILIDYVQVGVFLTAVRLSDGGCGVASTLASPPTHCQKKDRRFDDFTPTKIAGQSVKELFENSPNNNITDTLKLAVLNAISSGIINSGSYKVLEDTDPVDLLDLNSQKRITIVGAFNSYIRKISETNSILKVLEFNEDTFIDEHKHYYVPANEYKSLLPESDIIIITGLTLVNNTINGLLEVIPKESRVVLTGPSSSIVPDVLFKHNIDIIGATKIHDPEMLFKVAREAGTGYHLFKYCASKICILNE